MISVNYSLLSIKVPLSLMDGIHRMSSVEYSSKEVKREKKRVESIVHYECG